MSELIIKGIIYGVAGKTKSHPGKLVAALTEIPGLRVRELKFHPNGDFSSWGDVYRHHPIGEPFVKPLLEEIRTAMIGAGVEVTECESDVEDNCFGG